MDAFTKKDVWRIPDWEQLNEDYPNIANAVLREYHKNNGFIPYEMGFVYVIHALGTNLYKIGKSIHPDKRIMQISPKMPFKLEITEIYRSYFMSIGERLMHNEFDFCRQEGEWFEIPDLYLEELTQDQAGRRVKFAYVNEITKNVFLTPKEDTFDRDFLNTYDGEIALLCLDRWWRQIEGKLPSFGAEQTEDLFYFSNTHHPRNSLEEAYELDSSVPF